MDAKEAISCRILELCEMKDWNINKLANSSGITSSTIYSIINFQSKNPGIISIQKICDGFSISLRDFFDSELFDQVEQEIK